MEGGHFFPFSLCFSSLENQKYFEHGNLEIVRLMVIFTPVCTIIGLKESSDTESVVSFLAMPVTESFSVRNKEPSKHVFE